MVDIQLIWNWFLGVGSALGIALTILKIWEIAFSKPEFFLADNDVLRIHHKTGHELKVKYDFCIINNGRKGQLKILLEINPEQSLMTRNFPITDWMSIDKHSSRRIKGEFELNKYITNLEVKFPLTLVVNLRSIKKSVYKKSYRFNEDGSYISLVGRRTII